MSLPRDGPNPLRPYYIPPSINLPEHTPTTSSPGLKHGSPSSYASSARDIFSDIDYNDYLSDASPGLVDSVQRMINETFTTYVGVLCGQPFEIAKLVLQVRKCEEEGVALSLEARDERRDDGEKVGVDDYASDSEADEPAYFTSNAPHSSPYRPTTSRRRSARQRHGSRSSTSRQSTTSAYKLQLKRPDSVVEVLSQEWAREGGWGVWKGSNATFVYVVLQKTLESWSRSLLSSLLNVAEPASTILGSAMDVTDSATPWTSLGVAVASGVFAALILAPIDLIRTRLILTSTSSPNRSLLQNIRDLPSLACPVSLLLPTFFHSLIHPLREHSIPLLLRTRFAIDPVLTPTAYSLLTFLSRTVEIFIKLPVETVLRRGQASIITSQDDMAKSSKSTYGEDVETIVEFGPYNGCFGTAWSIMREEGSRLSPIAVPNRTVSLSRRKTKKGQGIHGLWRGWRVSVWGLVGLHASRAISGSTGSGGEF